MRPHISYRVLTAVCLVCLWALACVGLNGFAPAAIAQDSDLATPTTAPTWTPTVTGTVDPHATATSPPGTPATPTGRSIDFRADDRKINSGECVTFSWLVKGDIDKVEFDVHSDGKGAVLVSKESYDNQECPTETTEYSLIVSWLDGTQTNQTIKVKVEDSDDDGGDDGGGSQTVTPVTADFMPVTPLPISGLPAGGGGQAATPQAVAYQSATGGVVVTPIGSLGSVEVLPETGYVMPEGALGSVELLPETGYGPPPAAGEFRASNGLSPAHIKDHFKLCSVPVWPR